ncbi:MAG: hypothetical protein GY930_16190 [bacterium]|nr:hypothetical protein [bacterium]
MKWTIPLLLLLATLAIAGFAFRSVLLGTPESPREVCARLEQTTQLPNFDKRNALRSLSRSLNHPTARGDDELTRRLFRLRANIHREMKSFNKARSDVERMQALSSEEDVDLELEAIQLQAETGKTTEALRRVIALAERHPDAPTVPQLRGKLEADNARDWNEQAKELADQCLVRSDAQLAFPIIDSLCAQHLTDPRRTQVLRELRCFFSNARADKLGRILDLCEVASQHNRAARAAYAQGLENEMTISGLMGLLKLLVESDRPDLAVDLGVSSRVFPEILKSPGSLMVLIHAMEELGQGQRAGQIVSEWPWQDTTAPKEFYREVSKLLYKTGRFGPLLRAAQALRSFGSDDVTVSYFYVGHINGARSNYQNVMPLLSRFLNANTHGPVPGARSEAYRILAAGWAEQNQPQKALRALQGVIDSNGILVADDYLRLAEAQRTSPTSLPILPETNWAQAMMLAPERTEELMPMWKELGEHNFQSISPNFERFYTDLIRTGQSMTSKDVGPYTLYRIGMRHLDEQRFRNADSISKALLEDFPDLLPAIDLRLQALLSTKDTGHLGPNLLLKRLRMVGPDQKSKRMLAGFPIHRFSTEGQIELIRLDPIGTGRLRMAQWLFDQERYGKVELVLRSIPDHEDSFEVRVLRIKALFASGKYDQVIEKTKPLLSHEIVGQDCQGLSLRSRLAKGDKHGFLNDLRTLLGTPPRNNAARLQLAKELISKGWFQVAAPILTQLDSDSALRSSEVMELRALCASGANQTEQAQEFLSRAVPFFENGRIEMLQVILTAEAHDWPNLPLRIQRLNATNIRPTPLQEAGVVLLGADVQAGLEMTTHGLERHPGSMSWSLLHAAALSLTNSPSDFPPRFGPQAGEQARVLLAGSGDSHKDPRDTIAMLMAMDIAPWEVWVKQQALRMADTEPSNLWLGWIIAETQLRAGHLPDAKQTITSLIAGFPLCAPLWDHLFAVLNELHANDPLHPEILAARADQALAVSLREYFSPKQIALGLASQAMLQGHLDQSRARLERFLNATGPRGEPEVRWMLARLLAEQGEFSRAINDFSAILLRSNIQGLHPWIPEYLAWLDKASNENESSGTAPSVENLLQHLKALARRYPSDPHIALKRLQLRAVSNERNTILAGDEAQLALETIRSFVPDQSIDGLRVGSERTWMEYMLNLSPVLGEEYCRSALTLHPGNIDMWMGLSHALQAQGRIDETRAMISNLIQASDSSELHYRYASLLALAGEPAKTVHGHLTRADKLSGISGLSARNRFARAQTAMLHGVRNLDTVLSDLAQLWEGRDATAGEVQPLELGRVYLTALILRHRKADLDTLDVVTEAMLDYVDSDPYSEDIVRTFKTIGHSIGARLLASGTK